MGAAVSVLSALAREKLADERMGAGAVAFVVIGGRHVASWLKRFLRSRQGRFRFSKSPRVRLTGIPHRRERRAQISGSRAMEAIEQ